MFQRVALQILRRPLHQLRVGSQKLLCCLTRSESFRHQQQMEQATCGNSGIFPQGTSHARCDLFDRAFLCFDPNFADAARSSIRQERANVFQRSTPFAGLERKLLQICRNPMREAWVGSAHSVG